MTEKKLEAMLDAPKILDEPSEYPFHVGEYDERMRDRLRKRLPSWDKLVHKRTPEFKQFDKFLSTVFFDLWKPTNIKVSPLTKSAELMQKVLDIAHNMPEWKRLEERVKNQHALSAVAAITIGEHIVFPDDNGDGDQPGEGEGQGDSPGEGITDEMRQAIAEAVKKAEQAAEDSDTLSKMWGQEAGEDLSQDPELLLKLLGILKDSSRLQMVVEMLGRLKNQFYHSRMTRSEYVPEEFVDVELGNDLSKMLPYARLFLAVEELNTVFLMKYMQRALLQQVKEGREPLDRGPIVMLVDVSGSMDEVLGNFPGVGPITRVDWATAVALTIILLAKQQKREYFIGLFDHYMRRELKSSDGPVTVETVVNLLAVQAGGGTDFQRPLQRGLDVMLESEYDRADMVFVTDGYCHLPEYFLDKFNQAKKERLFRVLGIACASINPESITGFCDKVLSAASVLEADATTKHIFSMGDR